MAVKKTKKKAVLNRHRVPYKSNIKPDSLVPFRWESKHNLWVINYFVSQNQISMKT